MVAPPRTSRRAVVWSYLLPLVVLAIAAGVSWAI
jgi:hypothetical protein